MVIKIAIVLCYAGEQPLLKVTYRIIYEKRTSPTPIFRLSDKWYVRQMKFSGKLDARQVAWIFPSPAKLGTPSVKFKISRKWWMS